MIANIKGYPFNNQYNMQTHERIVGIDKEINEEKCKPTRDQHRINRLQEQKLIEGLFSTDQIGSMYGKYHTPW